MRNSYLLFILNVSSDEILEIVVCGHLLSGKHIFKWVYFIMLGFSENIKQNSIYRLGEISRL